MRNIVAATSILAASLVTGAVAQSFTTAPPGHEENSAYGFYYTDNFGGYSSSRMQYADGSLRGKKVTILQVKYRLRHYYNYNPINSPNEGLGRTWTRVTLSMANTDMSSMTRTFSQNALTTPQKVFDAQVRWPTVTSAQNPNPSLSSPNVFVVNPVWGQPASFPFSSAFVYDGTQDLLFDYDFQGGTLDNNIAWGTAHRPYPMDGIRNDPTQRVTFNGHYLPGEKLPACWDSGLPGSPTSVLPALAPLNGILYGDQFNTASYAGKIQLVLSTQRTARFAQVIGVLSLGGSDTGLNIGARCNNLYVNMSQVVLFTAGLTSTATPSLDWTSTGRRHGRTAAPANSA